MLEGRLGEGKKKHDSGFRAIPSGKVEAAASGFTW